MAFEGLTDKLQNAFKKLSGKGTAVPPFPEASPVAGPIYEKLLIFTAHP